MRRGPRPTTRALLCALLLSAAGGCDDVFSPTEKGEASLSIFGYLDVAADTQWVRITPVRPVKLTAPEPIGATVSLQELETGRVIQLRDSLFRFTHYSDPELGADGAWVHNFWTTERLEPGASYMFTAERAGEEAARALVTLPWDYGVEVGIRQASSGSDYLRLSGVRHLPFAAEHARFSDRCGEETDTTWFRDRTDEADGVAIAIRKAPLQGREGCGTPRLVRREFRVVASAVEWPEGQDHATSALGMAEDASNIDNALGFLGGVFTKRVPYESCRLQGGGGASSEHCRLRYGPATATLTGTVIETRCHDGALDSVQVELRELDGEPAGNRRIRETLSNPSGLFEVGALEPGIRYALKVRAKPEPDPFWGEVDIHSLHYDTLVFSPGERLRYDVELRRFTECGGER